MQGNKGITLIALVITVIVLIILIGVTANQFLSTNGFFHSTLEVDSKTEQEISNATDGMSNGTIEEKLDKGTGTIYVKADVIKFDVISKWSDDAEVELILKNYELVTDEGENYAIKDIVYSIKRESDSSYTSYQQGNISKFKCYFNNLTPNTKYTIGAFAEYKDSNGNSLAKIAETNVTTDKVKYLINEVGLGSYVDIGVNYENKRELGSANIETGKDDAWLATKKPLTGWRILSINGEGANATVKLVSAGTPLYYADNSALFESDFTPFIAELDTLYRENIQYCFVKGGVSSGDTVDWETFGYGFLKNGQPNYNIKEIFDNGKYIDTSKGVHTLRIEEIVELYNTITKQNKSLNEFKNVNLHNFNIASFGKTYEDLLICNGRGDTDDGIIIGAEKKENYPAQNVGSGNGQVWYLWNEDSLGIDTDVWGWIRIVVSLQPGVKIAKGNTGDGRSAATAIQITK